MAVNAKQRRAARRAKQFGDYVLRRGGETIARGSLSRVTEAIEAEFGRDVRLRRSGDCYSVMRDGWNVAHLYWP